MSFVKTGVIVSLVKRVIVSVFKAVYTILSLFNLHLTILVGLVGLVLYLTGVFDKYPAVELGFYFLFFASVILAVILSVRKLLGLVAPKEKKKRGVEIVEETDSANAPAPEPEQPPVRAEVAAETPAQPVPEPITYPRYFTVKQNKDYVMAEYKDRYELYFKDRNGLRKIRTDYKD